MSHEATLELPFETTATTQETPARSMKPRPCVERGYFSDDAIDERLFREAVLERVRAKDPIFPNRALGMEYAAINDGLPRGYPVAAVAVANLRPGEGFNMGGKRYTVDRIGKVVKFTIRDAAGALTALRLAPDSAKWEAFCRDIDGLLVGSFHGCDAGDLPAAWRRDPVSW